MAVLRSVSSLFLDAEEHKAAAADRGVDGCLQLSITDCANFPRKLDLYFIIATEGRFQKHSPSKKEKGPGVYSFSGAGAEISTHSKTNIRIEAWERHLFKSNTIVGVGYIHHSTRTASGSDRIPVPFRLYEPYLSDVATGATVNFLSQTSFAASSASTSAAASSTSSSTSDVPPQQVNDQEEESEESDGPTPAGSIGFVAKFFVPTLGVKLSFEAGKQAKSAEYSPSQKERQIAYSAEGQMPPQVAREKSQRKRKEARRLVKELARLHRMPTDERSRLFDQANALFGATLSSSDVPEHLAATIFSAWKDQQRQELINSQSRPPIPEDVCYVCQDTEGDWSDPLLELRCRHYIHKGCAEGQLSVSKVAPGELINLMLAKCGICRRWLDHSALHDTVLPYVRLYHKIAALARAQWKHDGGVRDGLVSTGEIVESMRFRTCQRCNNPFFDGKVECAAPPEDQNGREREAVCPECLNLQYVPPPGGWPSVCTVHGTEFVNWKCNWCCSTATFNCGGTVYFCERCHQRPFGEVYPCVGAPGCRVQHVQNDGQTPLCLGCGLCNFEGRMIAQIPNEQRARPANEAGQNQPAVEAEPVRELEAELEQLPPAIDDAGNQAQLDVEAEEPADREQDQQANDEQKPQAQVDHDHDDDDDEEDLTDLESYLSSESEYPDEEPQTTTMTTNAPTESEDRPLRQSIMA